MKKSELRRKLQAYREVNAEMREQIEYLKTCVENAGRGAADRYNAWRVREARITELEMLVQRLQDPEGYAAVTAAVKDLEDQAKEFPGYQKMWFPGRTEETPPAGANCQCCGSVNRKVRIQASPGRPETECRDSWHGHEIDTTEVRAATNTNGWSHQTIVELCTALDAARADLDMLRRGG